MNIFIALILVLIGGVINGSFALPTKHVPKWKFENIWLQYAIWTFLILPWVIAYFISPQIFRVYENAPTNVLVIMAIGGVVFGVGQVFFALAMSMIGIGLAFALNLGLSIILGFLLPLVIQHPGQMFSPFGIVTLIGCIFAIIGLQLSYRAGKIHDLARRKLKSPEEVKSGRYGLGIILAIGAGLSSAFQNFSFSFTAPMQKLALSFGVHHVGAASIMWPGFLVCGFIPYALYMLFLHNKNKSFGNYKVKGTGAYYIFAFAMGVLYYTSVMLYSKASQLIGSLGPLVGWPLFMALIVLTSNFWGWRSGEWEGCSVKVKRTILSGLSFIVLAIIVLGYSSAFHA